MSTKETGNIELLLRSFFQRNTFSSVHVFTDTNVYAHCYQSIKHVLPWHTLFTMQAGEQFKNIATATQFWDHLLHEHADRKALLVNLGGGVVSDMGGFCASVYKRGIAYINVPSSLLAMADASVGSKTGIDHRNAKNVIGSFYEPLAVFMDMQLLHTLPLRQLVNGKAEILKHGLIADENHFYKIAEMPAEQIPDSADLTKTVEIKQHIVQQDRHEQSIRKLLNFGHSVGHALESCFMQQQIDVLHGEAVAAGMICEAYLSTQTVALPISVCEKICAKVLRLFPKLDVSTINMDLFHSFLMGDKKNNNGQLLFVQLKSVGEAVWDVPVTAAQLDQALYYYMQL